MTDTKLFITWLSLTILASFVSWPLGIVALFGVIYFVRGGKMSDLFGKARHFLAGTSGNVSFDEHRAAVLRELEQEEGDFSGFMDQLRKAKDRAEFNQFMAARGKK